jgi:hypothetical protein
MLGDHNLLPAPGAPQVIAQLVFQSLDTDFGHGTASLAEEVAARADREARGASPPELDQEIAGPTYHAATKAARQSFWELYSALFVAFRRPPTS